MIRSPDGDPTRICTSEPDPDWTGFLKKLNRIGYGYPNCIDNCSKMLNQSFFGYKPDWIKCFDRSTGLGSDRITERKFWTGLGFQNSPICSTLIVYRFTQCCLTKLYILQKNQTTYCNCKWQFLLKWSTFNLNWTIMY